MTELGSVDENGSFAQFVEQMLGNTLVYSDMAASYESAGRLFEVGYGEYFRLNGETVNTDYARYENSYVVGGRVERGAEVIGLSFNGKTLTLNFEEGTREE